MRFVSFVVVLVTSLPALAAELTPARLAAPWLDRAAAELPAVRAQDAALNGPAKNVDMMLSEQSLALALFDCRPDDAARARLIALARAAERAKPAEDTPLGRLNAATVPALLYAAAGAREDARRFYPILTKAASEVSGLAALVAPGILTAVRSEAGDLTDEHIAQMRAIDMGITLRTLADDDRRADLARLTAAAIKRAGPPTADNRIEHMMLAKDLALSGQVKAARDLAAAMDRFTRHRPDAFAAIAEACHAAGDAEGRALNFRDALAAAAAIAAGSDRSMATWTILDAAVRTGDAVAIGAAADALTTVLDADPSQAWPAVRCDVAAAYVTLGRRADCDKQIARAVARIAERPGDDAFAAWLHVAGAHIRAGDKDGTKAAIDKATAIGPKRIGDRYEWDTVILAHARAGDFDAAVAAARAYIPKPDDRTLMLFTIGHLRALAGQYAGAEKTAAEITDPFRRFSVHRRIVVQRVKAKQADGLVAWIDAHPSARERAALNLAAAQQLLGRDGKGNSRVFAGPTW